VISTFCTGDDEVKKMFQLDINKNDDVTKLLLRNNGTLLLMECFTPADVEKLQCPSSIACHIRTSAYFVGFPNHAIPSK
jgi:hypothetical protein